MTYTVSYFVKRDRPMVYNLRLQKSTNVGISSIKDCGMGWYKVSKLITAENATLNYKLSLEEVKADLARIRESEVLNAAMEISRKYF